MGTSPGSQGAIGGGGVGGGRAGAGGGAPDYFLDALSAPPIVNIY